MPFSLAVDAYNLVADRRGMGRYVRRILDDWQDETDLAVTLIAKTPADETVLRREFPYDVARSSKGHDAVWFPWNAMRFDPRPRSALTLHDPFAFTLPHPNPIARWREQAPIRRGVARADVLIANSHWTAREAARVFGIDTERFTVIQPVPDAFWRPVHASQREPYILVVAGTDKRKNLATLFSAFERGFADGSVSLLVAGALNADDAFSLRRARFRYEHLLPDDEQLRDLYCGALAIAIPSTAEGYGIMAIEAMACGTPVIASDATALPEACDDAAMLVPSLDVAQWNHALARIVSEADLRVALRARSLERVARIDRGGAARLTLEVLRGKSAL